ncbi:hypothetical protein EVAR_76103_1 [Eumeta japonica]|uniref:Uncharacterized protein n=1 Tax=Eumeta variegata TaxID=151549 RepID=A0A4C1W6N7_EUMVA|nr:hypothetical protein EVAR_76103_1 [Eumeta japonica]
MSIFQGLMMEPEGKHRNSIMKQRILAVFGLVEIVLRCTLTMNDFQGLMMQLEGSDNGAGSLEAPSSDPESQSRSKSISGPFQQAQICERQEFDKDGSSQGGHIVEVQAEQALVLLQYLGKDPAQGVMTPCPLPFHSCISSNCEIGFESQLIMELSGSKELPAFYVPLSRRQYTASVECPAEVTPISIIVPSTGRPTAVMSENVAAAQNIIENDRPATYKQIRTTTGMGMTENRTISHNGLGVRRLVSVGYRWG